MQSILTQCPRCQTSFKVNDKQLAIAEGYVRCGSCLDVFLAIANRITIRQPGASGPAEDSLEDVYEDDEESETQTLEEGHATDAEITPITVNTAASTVDFAAIDLNQSVTLKYPVSQLVDANAVIPVNVVAEGAFALEAVELERVTAENAFSKETVAEPGAGESVSTKKAAAIDAEAEAVFRSIYATSLPNAVEGAPGPDGIADNQHTTNNREASYEIDAAGIPVVAVAEDMAELSVPRFGATQNNDGSLYPPNPFPPPTSSHPDDFQPAGFSALAVDAADKSEELTDLRSETRSRNEKQELRQYLASLEDADALEPLPATTMDAFEPEPLTLEVSHSFRRYISTFGWFCLSLALVAVFIVQVVAANLEFMQNSPTYSRYLPLFCEVLNCPARTPATAGIESLYSQDLVVRSHPRVPDALEVSFIFRNDADRPQSFPFVELSFRNSDRQLIANRLFLPEEYLPPELAVLDTMPARSSVQVMLELADPGSEAVDYEIIFRDPATQTLAKPARPAGVPRNL